MEGTWAIKPVGPDVTEECLTTPEGEKPDPTPPQEPEPITPTPEDPKPEAKTFTQEQVDHFNKEARKRAEKEAKQRFEQEFATKHGISLEEAESVLKQAKDAEDAKKSELERIREEKDRLEKQSADDLAAAQLGHHQDRVKLRLLKAGLPLPEDEKAAEEALESLVGLVRVDVGADIEDIDFKIKGLKEQFPKLFERESTSTTSTGNPPSNPSGTPRKVSLGKASENFGKEMAAQANAKRGVVPTA